MKVNTLLACVSLDVADTVCPFFLSFAPRIIVIEHPTLRKNGDIWVAPDEDTVVTRFFFVFAGSSRLNWQQMQVRTLDSTFQDEVKQAITVMGVGVDT